MTPVLDPATAARLVGPVEPGMRVRLVARGRSMWPVLRPGDEVEVAAAGDLRPGDVVLARLNDRLVIHRLVSTAGELCTLRGDACGAPDPPVRRSEVLGRVVARVRGGRRSDLDHPARVLLGSVVAALARWAPGTLPGSPAVRRVAVSVATGPLRPLTRRVAPMGRAPGRLGVGDVERFLAAAGEAAGADELRLAVEHGRASIYGAGAVDGRLVAILQARRDGEATQGVSINRPPHAGDRLMDRASREETAPSCWLRPPGFAAEELSGMESRTALQLPFLYVEPVYRRRGLARELLRLAASDARRAGAAALQAAVPGEVAAARGVLEAAGFRFVRALSADRELWELGLS